jgi:hypothetical protein
MLAVAFAAAKPNFAPQVVAYSAGLNYAYPGVPSVYSPYAAAPLAYSAGTVFVR